MSLTAVNGNMFLTLATETIDIYCSIDVEHHSVSQHAESMIIRLGLLQNLNEICSL